MPDPPAPGTLTRGLAARLLRRDLGEAWRVSNGGGGHGNTRRDQRPPRGRGQARPAAPCPAPPRRAGGRLLREDPSRDRLDTGGSAWTGAGESGVSAAARCLNYVLGDVRLYLVDWDEVDLSDPWRDAGIQLWWHVPPPLWARFTGILGATLDQDLANRIRWWTEFKALRNGYWVDLRGDVHTAELNARGLVRSMSHPRPA